MDSNQKTRNEYAPSGGVVPDILSELYASNPTIPVPPKEWYDFSSVVTGAEFTASQLVAMCRLDPVARQTLYRFGMFDPILDELGQHAQGLGVHASWTITGVRVWQFLDLCKGDGSFAILFSELMRHPDVERHIDMAKWGALHYVGLSSSSLVVSGTMQIHSQSWSSAQIVGPIKLYPGTHSIAGKSVV